MKRSTFWFHGWPWFGSIRELLMTPNPNWFAIFALVSWPVVAMYLYFTRPVAQATLWTILGAYLLLPVGPGIHFEGVPAFNKASIGNLCALIGVLLVVRRLRLWNGFGLTEVLVLTFLISPFVTEELNTDPIVLADRVLPAGSFYDALSAVVSQFLAIIPFFIGRRLLRSSTDTEAILRVLVVAGLFYSLPILFEIRMSPQLHAWIYGYIPSEWGENVRFGGYRPMVFIGHGLGVAFFVMTTVVAAAALWRARTRVAQLSPAGVTGYLSVILVLCKGVSALVYGAVLVVLVRWTSTKFQARIAVALVTIALCYPLLRSANLVPTDAIVEAATELSQDRADSLKFRFNNERRILDHASDRIFFGWGRFGRELVYDEKYGKNTSITDGQWIATLGTFGLVGFFAEFGLLVLPIYRVASALRFTVSMRDGIYLAALALISATNTIDLLPNAGLTPWTWLVAGALLGRAESLRAATRKGKNLDFMGASAGQHAKTLSTS